MKNVYLYIYLVNMSSVEVSYNWFVQVKGLVTSQKAFDTYVYFSSSVIKNAFLLSAGRDCVVVVFKGALIS